MTSRPKLSKTASKRTRGIKQGRSGAPEKVLAAGNAREPVPVASNDVVVGRAKTTIRFFCQGIGDCHLLKFRRTGAVISGC